MNRTVGVFEIFELVYLHSSRGQDPFDVECIGTFVHQSGTQLRIEGFFDGDDTYRLRFMPVLTGRWKFWVLLDGKVLEKGELDCQSSSCKGPLLQDAKHPYHFVFSNGEPFYMMGNTVYQAIIACRETPDEFREFLDYYARRQFNWHRFGMANGRSTNGGVVWPWGGTPEEPKYDAFDIQHYRHAENVVNELATRQMIASVILLNDQPLEMAGSKRMAVAKRHIRYTVARLSACWNVVWCLFNEWNKFSIFSYEEADELGNFLHQLDPYKRLTACHHYARFEFFNKAWTDMSSMQHRGLPGEINRVVLQNRNFNKPVLNEEYGYEGDTLQPPSDADNVRYDHWAIALAGGYASYGDKTKGPKIGSYFTCRLSDMRGTSAPDKLQYLPFFMQRTGYREMIPCNAFLSRCNPEEVFCLANPGKEYIVYFVRSQSAVINLAHARGPLKVEWFNPRSGEFKPGEDVYAYQDMQELPEWMRGEHSWVNMHRHHNVEFNPPEIDGDWVLYLKAA